MTRLPSPLAVLGALVLVVPLVACAEPPYAPRAGDVVFQALPHTPLVDAIEGVSDSPFSHCGLVVEHDGRFAVLEAFGDVHLTWLDDWLERGRDEAFSVYRLDAARQQHVDAFLEAARAYHGRPYDWRYAMDDEALYCSELVWKAWRDVTGELLCDPQPLRALDWQPWVETIEELEGGEAPLDREIVTPRAVAESPALVEVLHHGWSSGGAAP